MFIPVQISRVPEIGLVDGNRIVRRTRRRHYELLVVEVVLIPQSRFYKFKVSGRYNCKPAVNEALKSFVDEEMVEGMDQRQFASRTWCCFAMNVT